MFSFFRKKDQDGNDVPAGPATIARGEASYGSGNKQASQVPAGEARQYDLSALSIEVESASNALSDAEEQAAMLYASGQSDAAIAVLEADRPHFTGKKRTDSWLMLFELYQQTNQREAFDALAMDYVVEFEKTPPIWRVVHTAKQQKAAASGFYALGAQLVINSIEKEIIQLMSAREKNADFRLELGKVRNIDTLGAAELLAALQRCRKMPGQMRLQGVESMRTLLASRIEVGRCNPAEAPLWLLLIELFQLSGQQEAFENLAVDYAITFEVSPPSWNAAFVPAKADIKDEPQPEADSLVLRGQILAGEQELMTLLNHLVESQEQTAIDFGDMHRIDFESCGQLMNQIMGWLQKGKTVRFYNVNALVMGMMRIMSLTDMITIERRKK